MLLTQRNMLWIQSIVRSSSIIQNSCKVRDMLICSQIQSINMMQQRFVLKHVNGIMILNNLTMKLTMMKKMTQLLQKRMSIYENAI